MTVAKHDCYSTHTHALLLRNLRKGTRALQRVLDIIQRKLYFCIFEYPAKFARVKYMDSVFRPPIEFGWADFPHFRTHPRYLPP